MQKLIDFTVQEPFTLPGHEDSIFAPGHYTVNTVESDLLQLHGCGVPAHEPHPGDADDHVALLTCVRGTDDGEETKIELERKDGKLILTKIFAGGSYYEIIEACV